MRPVTGNRQQAAYDPWLKLRFLVVGLGREGTAVARFLAERGAAVTVTDTRPAEALRENIAQIVNSGVSLALGQGEHPTALLDETDILVVSPGVPLDVPFLVEARRRNLPLSSETRLFVRTCPAPIIGITGSSGKTTTTTLVGEMLQAAGHRTWVGGNIGRPLITHIAEIAPTDRVVVELSSFQLDLLGDWPGTYRHPPSHDTWAHPDGWSPHIAAILNIRPNHLDRHGTLAAYTAAKRNIVAYQQPGDVAVLNLDDPTVRDIGRQLHHDVAWFSLEQPVASGAFLRPRGGRHGDELVLCHGAATSDPRETVICERGDVLLLGEHNLANVLAACVIASQAGVAVDSMREVITTFRGVEHRLELVRERGGVRWYNDSIATAPERTVAALRSFDTPIVLLAGGRDKHLPWGEMASLAQQKARHVILFGEAAPTIERALEAIPPGGPGLRAEVHMAGSLERAVTLAAQLALPGDVVLLSPGGTSFDAYADFCDRGEHFCRLVEALE
ncbi:MAG: UDP-N-acetylmuramoyl-L-alanine--D-glutamate ligase [Anaerolineae bacterium]|nr:UDP-N-acetylmuramoyl-L-alanine--D-glutamate ligase [Anaerolineae bacterium]